MRSFVRVTFPVILNEGIWSLGVTVFPIVYARMGTDIIAAVNIASTIEKIPIVFFYGMASACAIMVGNQLGAGSYDNAYYYSKKIMGWGVYLGIVASILLVTGSGPMLSIFKLTPSSHDLAFKILLIVAIMMVVKILNMIIIVGVLRSGGDTKFSLIIDTAGVWFIAIPLAVLGGLVWSLPAYWVYLLISLDELFKLLMGLRRFVSRKWMNRLTENHIPTVPIQSNGL
jgi:Na+-driven multidrug efflux pump